MDILFQSIGRLVQTINSLSINILLLVQTFVNMLGTIFGPIIRVLTGVRLNTSNTSNNKP
jgi:predicted permease